MYERVTEAAIHAAPGLFFCGIILTLIVVGFALGSVSASHDVQELSE